MRAKLFLLFVGFSIFSFSQEKNTSTFSSIDVNYFKGNIALHNDGILHLITGHPEGVIISWNKKTFGFNTWEQRYNYPDYGVSFSYQNLKNEVLGNNYALYGHYNFYFLNRNLMVRIGQGLSYTTNPYDKETNHKNIAFGTKLMSSTYAMINYKRERIFDNFGFQAGLSLIHYSNANVKAPNTSINSLTLSAGVTYNFDDEDPEYQYDLSDDIKFKQPIKYNVVFRSGVNESDVLGSGQFPFYIVSAYADKRLNRKSAIQFGVDAFFSRFLKELIYYESIAFSDRNIDPDTDYKRLGVFVGHELFINKLSIEAQLGYYAYYPHDFEGRVYQRIGAKRYFGDKWFVAVTLKSHAAKAEAVELGIGIRF
ncbi:acyloxyacyl hydrolase [Flavobacteriaceae bacterium S0825]|uniref:acyloxyacyl hydrolase n=1 Tax=Gaetbulibacter sp. S0825 TaxID=2720084 RepID=UPI00143044D2|nr:acyloxyacyl hydrolase [Gaetbulibacter sp. S0825]MCK0108613.1 acyloxyacyl hydrolase [Flavobacteriaceae bacterium S0825]NIX64249.1 acyloxyacyl hydrolase [Gaetbulibacter sp. S0825]